LCIFSTSIIAQETADVTFSNGRFSVVRISSNARYSPVTFFRIIFQEQFTSQPDHCTLLRPMKYKYRNTEKNSQKFWICETCKKRKIQTILTGRLRLIDQSNDPEVLSTVCEGIRPSVNEKN